MLYLVKLSITLGFILLNFKNVYFPPEKTVCNIIRKHVHLKLMIQCTQTGSKSIVKKVLVSYRRSQVMFRTGSGPVES